MVCLIEFFWECIRSEDDRTYQLPLKDLAYLNKRFNQAGIQDHTRYIEQLLDLFRHNKFSEAFASGTLARLPQTAHGRKRRLRAKL